MDKSQSLCIFLRYLCSLEGADVWSYVSQILDFGRSHTTITFQRGCSDTTTFQRGLVKIEGVEVKIIHSVLLNVGIGLLLGSNSGFR